MRQIKTDKIIKAVKELCMSINYKLPQDTVEALKKALKNEVSALGKEVLKQILDNNKIASSELVPLCQDTGVVIAFIELGQEVHIIGNSLNEAIDEGVRQGYKEGSLRKSIVKDPLNRKNTGDNTPAVIHVKLTRGDKLRIDLMVKGAGSENMSAISMLAPSDGIEGIEKFVIDTVRKAGANPCPPIVVGVGIGGTFEQVALLAKKALLRPLNLKNTDSVYDRLEKKLLKEINKLGIGPQGFEGRISALAVHIKKMPCHIASLPVAVNINCHVARHGSIVL